jgi:hypothetical protein
MTRKITRLVLGAVLLALLTLGALFGNAVTGAVPGLQVSIPVAHADCDTNPPPPGLNCPQPTPTPTPLGQ